MDSTSRYVVSFSSKQCWLHFPILVAKVKISFTHIFHHNLIIKYWYKHIQQDPVYSHFVLLKNIQSKASKSLHQFILCVRGSQVVGGNSFIIFETSLKIHYLLPATFYLPTFRRFFSVAKTSLGITDPGHSVGRMSQYQIVSVHIFSIQDGLLK